MPPRVSVIIPAYNSGKTIGACLKALYAQTWQDFETILVDSSREELTCQIVTRDFPQVKLIEHPQRLLPHAARNIGASQARGELLVFTDPDCCPRPDWLAQLVRACQAGHQIVTGSIEQDAGNWFQQGVHLCKFVWGLSGLPAREAWIATTANACYARSVWQAAGPFQGDIWCGDAVLSWRARACGHATWFEPRAVVVHELYHGNVRSLWKERFERGAEFARVRAEFGNWSRLRTGVYAVAFPLAFLIVLARGMRDALAAGRGLDYLMTLHVSFVGQLAWCLGETRTYGKMATLPAAVILC